MVVKRFSKVAGLDNPPMYARMVKPQSRAQPSSLLDCEGLAKSPKVQILSDFDAHKTDFMELPLTEFGKATMHRARRRSRLERIGILNVPSPF
jgi:hypothetical protein